MGEEPTPVGGTASGPAARTGLGSLGTVESLLEGTDSVAYARFRRDGVLTQANA